MFRFAILNLSILLLACSACSKAPESVASNLIHDASSTDSTGNETAGTESTVRYRYPVSVSRFDFQTRDDLFTSHLLQRVVDPDNLSSSVLVSNAVSELGSFFGDLIEAQNLASLATSGFQIRGHKTFEKTLVAEVEDCAKILNVDVPEVFIINDPQPNAYASGINDDYQLVLTSGLLDLYAGRPEELRFIIGHELGHIKCNHMRMKAISFAFFSVFQRLENRWLRDTAMQGILPSLGMGRLLKWSRDAEFSADRAGLLCCQSDRVAYDALMNLSLGLRPDSPWRDQQYESLDEDVVIQNFDDWGNRPLVEFFIEVKKWSATHPFIPDRLAAIKAWWKTGGAESVLARTADTTCTLDLNFTSIGVEGLEEGSDPYLIALDHNGLELGRTPTQSDKQNAFWRDLSWLDVPNDVGNPVFVQVWEENYSLLPDSLLGVFVVYPNREDLVYRSTILWDVDDRTGVSRNGVGSIKFKRK